jgi:endo-1,4-beta-xylanase
MIITKRKKQLLIFSSIFLVSILLTVYSILDGRRSFDTTSSASSESLCSYYSLADLNEDERISLSDFQSWLTSYREFKESEENYSEKSDFNSDNKISLADFSIWLGLWREYKLCRSDNSKCRPGCESILPVCGDGICATEENVNNCPADCYVEVEDPECSANAREYDGDEDDWAVNFFCKNGEPDPPFSTLKNNFPSKGQEVSWKCINGPKEISCSAKRNWKSCSFPNPDNSTLSKYAQKKENFNVSTILHKCSQIKDSSDREKCEGIILSEYSSMMLAVQENWKYAPYEDYRDNVYNPGWKFKEQLDFAKNNKFKLHFFHLIWPAGNQYPPDWFLSSNPFSCRDWSREEMLDIMRWRIQTTIKYLKEEYGDLFVAWNVVNEVISEEGALEDTCFLKIIGEDYIKIAFDYAHEVAPNDLLVFNDNPTGRKEINFLFNYIDELKKDGVQIDAVGIQNHLLTDWAFTNREEYLRDVDFIFTRASEVGVKVLITEMDVYQGENNKYTQEQVASIYKEVVSRCLDSENCVSFGVWGISDKYSWLRGYLGLTDARPLLFDELYNRKPSYYSVMEAISENTTRKCPF